MRVPLNWLHEYCSPGLPAHKLAERLAMTGTEVERVTKHGVTGLEKFVVGRILSAERHPNADKLNVCIVDLGDPANPSQIVCGAPNVAAGQTVAVAQPGAVLPGGTTLTRATIRGVESAGMILAEDELEIGDSHAGIIVLAEGRDTGDGGDAPAPGTPLADVLPIATDVLELEITQNRPDCLGIYGVAREVHAATGAPLTPPPWANDPGAEGDVNEIEITVRCPELCPRFTARAFDNVTIAESPLWLKARLIAAGQRPISNVVDITNYVMLLTGQPLHAFDLDRIAGAQLTVRKAHDGERMETLDGQTRTLDADMVVIDDAAGPTSIAGVMGGARSEVVDTTTRVLMEVANWIGPNIHRTGLKLGLRTEASARFEKQLQPEQAIEAQAVATRLMIELTGARLLPGTVDIGGPGPEPKTIRLRDARIEGLLGTAIPRERTTEILHSLEFATADAGDGLDVKPPAFRRDDIIREADLIEEVARLHGLEKLPATLPATRRAAEAALRPGAPAKPTGRLTARQLLHRRAADALAAQGLHEVVGWSFTGPELAERLRLSRTNGHTTVELHNPMSAEQSHLRTTLLGSLLDVARHNRAHGAGDVRLFEAGAVYLPPAEGLLPNEPYHAAALLIGPVRPPTWREPAPQTADFFAVKGVVEGLLGALRTPFTVRPAHDAPFLHPGRAADILVVGEPVGVVGELHPLVAAEWDIEDTVKVAVFELDLDALPEPPTATYEDLTSFPQVREDLAVIVADTVTAEQAVSAARRAGEPLLRDVAVFDVYRDPERIGEGNVSLALRLTYRAADRTLTDEEVADRRQAIAGALAAELGGRVRAG